MPQQAEMKLRINEAEKALAERLSRRTIRRAFLRDLDGQLTAALARIESTLQGQDVHKWLADELTDDEEHPVSVTQVYDWLSRRNGRRPPAELVHVVAEHDALFMAWWCESSGYERPSPISRLSPEEQVEEYRRQLRALGDVGARLDAEVQARIARGENGVAAIRSIGVAR